MGFPHLLAISYKFTGIIVVCFQKRFFDKNKNIGFTSNKEFVKMNIFRLYYQNISNETCLPSRVAKLQSIRHHVDFHRH